MSRVGKLFICQDITSLFWKVGICLREEPYDADYENSTTLPRATTTLVCDSLTTAPGPDSTFGVWDTEIEYEDDFVVLWR